jgi:hypothetical protein
MSLSSFIGLLLKIKGLGDAAFTASPGTNLDQEQAYVHALAATAASSPEVRAEVLLSMAWIESRYYPEAVSRIENGVRVTGVPRWSSPPKGTYSFFCGVTQVSAGNSWKKCQQVRDIFVAYRETVKELEQWMSPRICAHNLRCALTGYSGGFAAIKSGTNPYARFALGRARVLERSMHRKRVGL